jgi:osmotically inducible lipoprotein OsmB
MQETYNMPTAEAAKRATPWPRVLVASLLVGLTSCAMNESQERVASGAAIGAIAGAVLGTSRQSAAIGAAAGAAGGYLYDKHQKKADSDTENERLRRENERLTLEAENRRLQEEQGQ